MTRESFAHNLSDPRQSPDRACAGVETELFFSDFPAQISAAQRVCEHCPVLARCAAWALREDFTDGVVASVRMPAGKADLRTKKAAWIRLEFVAATGLSSIYRGTARAEAA